MLLGIGLAATEPFEGSLAGAVQLQLNHVGASVVACGVDDRLELVDELEVELGVSQLFALPVGSALVSVV